MIGLLSRITSTGPMSARLRIAALAALMLMAVTAGACIQENNTYPIEIFDEMHYSQAYRALEPPRLAPAAEAVTFDSAGGPSGMLEVPERQERPYDPQVAARLYEVNCSVCHGTGGQGDGPAAPYITSQESFYATEVSGGQAYAPPPNLLESRDRLDQNGMYQIIHNGINVMPRFANLLTEAEIRDIVNFVYDREQGLGAQ